MLYISILLPCCSVYEYPVEGQHELIGFRCSVDNESTKSFSYMEDGIIVLIYAFNENCVYYPLNGTPLTACSTGNGVLTTNNPMSLPDGFYDFYSLSCNSSIVPTVNIYRGFTGTLENGMDYLFASSKRKNLADERIIYLIYKHLSSQVKISVSAGNNVTALSVKDIQFTYPSNSAVALDLSQGIVSPSQSVEALSSIPGIGNNRTFIVLPCIATMDILVLLDANIDGEYISGRRFHSRIDLDFESGSSYDITLILNTDNTITTTCKPKGWEPLSQTITY